MKIPCFSYKIYGKIADFGIFLRKIRLTTADLLCFFAPFSNKQHPSMAKDPATQEKQGLLSSLFGSPRKDPKHDHSIPSTSMLKQRKAPIKVEPKVFFANERTFLAWMHISIILAGASIAILAFSEEGNPASQVYGIVMLPVAVAFIIYSMYQCKFVNLVAILSFIFSG